MASTSRLAGAALLLLPSVALAGGASWVMDEVKDDAQSLVQVQARMHNQGNPHLSLYTREGGSGSPNECGEPHEKDLNRPVNKVLMEHPDIDGRCYFQFAAPWFNYVAVDDYADHARDTVFTLQRVNQTCFNWKGHGSANKSTAILPSGEKVVGHIDCQYYARDDLMYYSMGWLHGQGLNGSLMTNRTAWKELAAAECSRIREENQFTEAELSMSKHLENQKILTNNTACAWGYFKNETCEPYTDRQAKLHVYMSCLLGHAAADMAFAYMHACVLQGVIAHGSACGLCPDGDLCP